MKEPTALELEIGKLDIVCPENLPKATPSELEHIRRLLTYIVDSLKEKEKDKETEDEWRALAMVLDRIFFWITTIMAFVMIPTFLLRRSPSM